MKPEREQLAVADTAIGPELILCPSCIVASCRSSFAVGKSTAGAVGFLVAQHHTLFGPRCAPPGIMSDSAVVLSDRR